MKVIEKTLPASELPAAWQREGAFAPTDQVRVRIELDDPELAEAKSFVDVMRIMGRRARAQGLTEDKLDAIMNER